MLEQTLNIWDVVRFDVPVCITTNGNVKKDGSAVMGKGIAKQAADRVPYLAVALGHVLKTVGNRVFVWKDGRRDLQLITFPTKHNWWEKSDIELIRTSAEQLLEYVNEYKIPKVYLPRPGCANGQLDWETEVKPVLEPLLDDRFIIVDYK